MSGCADQPGSPGKQPALHSAVFLPARLRMRSRIACRGRLERLGSPGMDDKGTPGRRVASGGAGCQVATSGRWAR